MRKEGNDDRLGWVCPLDAGLLAVDPGKFQDAFVNFLRSQGIEVEMEKPNEESEGRGGNNSFKGIKGY